MTTPEVRQTVIGDHNIFAGTGDVEIKYQLSPAEGKARLPLTQLVESVKQFWIEGVLERSLHEVAALELRKEPLAEAIEHPWEHILELPGQPAHPVGGDQHIGVIFADTGRALLILGEPGAGKTTTLLELARDLIRRFETDPTQAAPVVLNLSTWRDRRRSLGAWIEMELQNKYFVPARRTRGWLGDGRLLLLLDGLDEVPEEGRSACVGAINEFIRTAGVPGIAVCSRLSEYTTLTERLTFTAAVRLKPLTSEQVDDYLERGGARLAALRQVIQQDALLRELASSPLMLSVISLAYQDLPSSVVAEQTGDTVESRRAHLFRIYVARMFQRGGKAPDAFPEGRVKFWLSWLASRMREHALSVFLLENLQPTWLASDRDRWRYAFASRVASALAWAIPWWILTLVFMESTRPFFVDGMTFTLLGATLVGMVAGLVAGRRLTSPAPGRPWAKRLWLAADILVQPLVLGIVFGALGGVFFERLEQILLGIAPGPKAAQGHWLGFITGVYYGMTFGLVFGFKGARSAGASDIRLSDKLSFSFASARRGAAMGGLGGVIVGTILGWFAVLAQWQELVHRYRPLILSAGLALVLLLLALIVGVIGALVGATFNMLASNDLPVRPHPEQGLRAAAQNAIAAGLAVGATLTLPFATYAMMTRQGRSVTQVAMEAGMGVTAWALAAAAWYGGLDVIQHLTVRAMLLRSGSIPRQYTAFLDHATRLIFLQKVGPGYIFIHRQLLDHFADTRPDVS